MNPHPLTKGPQTQNPPVRNTNPKAPGMHLGGNQITLT